MHKWKKLNGFGVISPRSRSRSRSHSLAHNGQEIASPEASRRSKLMPLSAQRLKLNDDTDRDRSGARTDADDVDDGGD